MPESALFIFGVFSSVGQAALCAAVAGAQAGHALRGVMVAQQEAGRVRRGHYSSCFLSVGGPRGVFDDRGERLDDLSSPLPHTSLSPTCVSQRQVNMVTQLACRSAMCFQGRTGSAA